MDPTLDLPTLLKLVTSHQWLPVALALVVYARFILSDQSRFRATIPARWLPAVTALGGAIFAVLVSRQAGASWGMGVVAAATSGVIAALLDGLAVGIWGDPAKAPWYARLILMLGHDVAGGGGAGGAGAGGGKPPASSGGAGPKLAARMALGATVLAVWLFGAFGCGDGASYPVLDKIEKIIVQDFSNGAADAVIAQDVCAALGGTSQTDAVCADVGPLIADTIQLLIQAGVLQGPAAERGKAFMARHAALLIERDQRAAVEVLQAASVSP